MKAKEAEDMISNLKVKVEEGMRIEDFLNIKPNEKIVECLKLEEEIVSLRKELEKTKEIIDKGLKLRGGYEILNELINSHKPSKEKSKHGFEKGKSPISSAFANLYDNFKVKGKSETMEEKACIENP